MKKLIAQRPILYQGRTYARGEAVPAYDDCMVQAWLRADSAQWQDIDAPEQDTGELEQDTGELEQDTGEPEQDTGEPEQNSEKPERNASETEGTPAKPGRRGK